MADVFLSYARSSAAMAKQIAAALRSHGCSVWFDEELPAHRAYADVIAAELDAAQAVLVLWSEAASRSQWVRSEANRARERGNLVQLRLDEAQLPMPFDQIQCADLCGWDHDEETASWRSIIGSVTALVRGDSAQQAVPPLAPVPRKASVAVLPLRNLGPGEGGDYLGEGLAEEIITSLARLPGLRIASAAGATAQPGLAACDIASALGAGSYLEGSVRRSGDRARISLRLVDAKSGFARWSETFERSLADLFAVQEEIARAVTASLGVALLDRDADAISAGGSSDAQANELFLKARHLVRQELEVERRTAADLFRQAIARDPQFALAHAGLADVLAQMARWHLPGWEQLELEALAAAEKAVALAPALADAHIAHGAALRLCHDPGARDAYARALALSPADPNVHYRLARFLVLEGDKVDAVAHYERAFELAPDDYRYIVYALQEYQALGDEAGEQRCLHRSAAAIERHLELNPADVRALGHGAGVAAVMGRSDKAQRLIDRALALRPGDYGNLCTLACAAMLNNDPEQALDLLERASATGEGDREWVMQDNDLKPLHGHPRFETLIAGMT